MFSKSKYKLTDSLRSTSFPYFVTALESVQRNMALEGRIHTEREREHLLIIIGN